MKTCLVTGGAGFIGSHLCDKLIEEGFRVVCVDNLLTGSEENIKHLENKEEFVFIKADVSDPKTYKENLSGKYEFIFHLASPASPNKNSKMSYLAHPVKTMLVNSVGTHYLLELAKREKARFLFTSTSEVYGDPKEHPQKETYWGNVNPNGLRACYDESKRFGEAMTMVYTREHNVDARIVRIFNTYGPRIDPHDGRAMVNFIIQGLTFKPFTIYGDGKQTRSFCYVSDVVEGITKAMFLPKTRAEVINLGNPDEHSMNELVNVIAKKLKVEKEIKHSKLPEDDPTRRRPDVSKAAAKLNWKPLVSLDEGLTKTITYFKKHLP